MRRAPALLAAGLAFAVLAGGCRPPDPADALRETTWRADDMAGRGIVAGARPTLRIDATGRASGTAGCNQFTGPASLSGDELRLGPFATTRRMCLPAVMDQEERYLEALAAARRFALVDGTLRLRDEQDRELVRFVERE